LKTIWAHNIVNSLPLIRREKTTLTSEKTIPGVKRRSGEGVNLL